MSKSAPPSLLMMLSRFAFVIQVLQVRKNGQSDASDLILCSSPHTFQSTTRTLPDKPLPNASVNSKQDVAITNITGKISVEASDDLDEVRGYSLFHTLVASVRGCACVPKELYKVHIERSFPFSALFNNISQCVKIWSKQSLPFPVKALGP